MGRDSHFLDPHPRPGSSLPPAPGEPHLMLWEAKAPTPSVLHPAGRRGLFLGTWSIINTEQTRARGPPSTVRTRQRPCCLTKLPSWWGVTGRSVTPGWQTSLPPAGLWSGCCSARNSVEMDGPGGGGRWAVFAHMALVKPQLCVCEQA